MALYQLSIGDQTIIPPFFRCMELSELNLSPLVPVFRPKIILYQLFQVFPDYKAPIQDLTLKTNNCIIGQKHWYKPSILVYIYYISQSKILFYLENKCIHCFCINHTCEKFWLFQFYSLWQGYHFTSLVSHLCQCCPVCSKPFTQLCCFLIDQTWILNFLCQQYHQFCIFYNCIKNFQ